MLILSLDLKEKKAYVDPMVCCFEIGNMFFNVMIFEMFCTYFP